MSDKVLLLFNWRSIWLLAEFVWSWWFCVHVLCVFVCGVVPGVWLQCDLAPSLGWEASLLWLSQPALVCRGQAYLKTHHWHYSKPLTIPTQNNPSTRQKYTHPHKSMYAYISLIKWENQIQNPLLAFMFVLWSWGMIPDIWYWYVIYQWVALCGMKWTHAWVIRKHSLGCPTAAFFHHKFIIDYCDIIHEAIGDTKWNTATGFSFMFSSDVWHDLIAAVPLVVFACGALCELGELSVACALCGNM